jgi:uncharacterized coiled-coil protein SlyX
MVKDTKKNKQPIKNMENEEKLAQLEKALAKAESAIRKLEENFEKLEMQVKEGAKDVRMLNVRVGKWKL